MIKGLDQRVDIIFEPDTRHFLLTIPYCAASKDFLGCWTMICLGIQRTWMPELKAWRFNSEDYDAVTELLPDFLSAPEDIEDIFGDGGLKP